MKHLTVDEMIDFVSIKKIDASSLALASRVNTHIRECDRCLSRVRALVDIYDELERRGLDNNASLLLEALSKNADADCLHDEK